MWLLTNRARWHGRTEDSHPRGQNDGQWESGSRGNPKIKLSSLQSTLFSMTDQHDIGESLWALMAGRHGDGGTPQPWAPSNLCLTAFNDPLRKIKKKRWKNDESSPSNGRSPGFRPVSWSRKRKIVAMGWGSSFSRLRFSQIAKLETLHSLAALRESLTNSPVLSDGERWLWPNPNRGSRLPVSHCHQVNPWSPFT